MVNVFDKSDENHKTNIFEGIHTTLFLVLGFCFFRKRVTGMIYSCQKIRVQFFVLHMYTQEAGPNRQLYCELH